MESLTQSRGPPHPTLAEQQRFSPWRNSNKGPWSLGTADTEVGRIKCWAETRESEHSEGLQSFGEQVTKMRNQDH